jgi:hypothetical protein
MELKTFTFTDKKPTLTNDERIFLNGLSDMSFKISSIDIMSDNIEDIVIKIHSLNLKRLSITTPICLYKYLDKAIKKGDRYIISYDNLSDELKTEFIVSSTIGLNIEIELISNKEFSITIAYELVQKQKPLPVY